MVIYCWVIKHPKTYQLKTNNHLFCSQLAVWIQAVGHLSLFHVASAWASTVAGRSSFKRLPGHLAVTVTCVPSWGYQQGSWSPSVWPSQGLLGLHTACKSEGSWTFYMGAGFPQRQCCGRTRCRLQSIFLGSLWSHRRSLPLSSVGNSNS